MRPAVNQYRACLHIALAALVVVASLHCAWEWQAALKHMAVVATYRAAQQQLPLLPRPGCENESGCICRGATQAQPLDVTHLQASPAGTLSGDTLALTLAPLDMSASGSLTANHQFSLPPISGRQLRARYASFLI